jgi:hypothetical protein
MITNKMVCAFMVGAAVGAAVATLLALAMAWPVLHRGAALVEKMSAQIVEYESAGTVLYEPGAAPKCGPIVPILDGTATLTINCPPGAPPAPPVARWYIPAKVKPIYYGDHPGDIPAGVSFAYYTYNAGVLTQKTKPEAIYSDGMPAGPQ